jgi:hypothetical protein
MDLKKDMAFFSPTVFYPPIATHVTASTRPAAKWRRFHLDSIEFF